MHSLHAIVDKTTSYCLNENYNSLQANNPKCLQNMDQYLQRCSQATTQIGSPTYNLQKKQDPETLRLQNRIVLPNTSTQLLRPGLLPTEGKVLLDNGA